MRNKLRKFFAIVLAFVVALTFFQTPVSSIIISGDTAYGTLINSSDFTETDVIIAVAHHIKSKYQSNDYPVPTSVYPMYNLCDEVIAYKAVMSDGSYIVVNANKDNPVVIEFSDPGMMPVEYSGTNEKEYYLAPGFSVSMAPIPAHTVIDQLSANIGVDPTYIEEIDAAFAKMLNTPNDDIATMHKEIKSQLENYRQNTAAQTSSDKDKTDEDEYDFLISWLDLPYETYYYKMLKKADDISNWGTTSEFADLADDHCAATSAFNVLHYFSTLYGNPISSADRLDVFEEIHNYVKNGPVTPSQYRNRFRSYIKEQTSYGISVINTLDLWSSYKNRIQDGYMNIMCVWPELLSAHMINGVGYREYPSGNYCVVIDNWNASGYKYTLFGEELYDLFSIKLTEEEQ